MMKDKIEVYLSSLKEDDTNFIYDNITLLTDGKYFFKKEEFLSFLKTISSSEIWILKYNKDFAGYLILNKLAMPRYIGYTLDIEEIVITSKHQNKGLGRLFLEEIITNKSLDKMARKISIKSNDINGSCKLYNIVFEASDFIYFSKFLNKI